MSVLDQAVQSRIEDFKVRLLQYKREYEMTSNALSVECELSNDVVCNFIHNKKGMYIETAYKISLATGIAL